MSPADRLRALPLGSYTGQAFGRRYAISKTAFANRASLKLVAEALDGSDYISANLYDLASGPRIFPCEMPIEKVAAFLSALDLCKAE